MSNFKTYATDALGIKNGNLILATTMDSKIDRLSKAVLIDTGKIIVVRNNFDEIFEENNIENNIENENELNIVETQKTYVIEEREYLLDCYKIFSENTKKKFRFQLPCGTGKTFIILFMIKKALEEDSESKFLILCPWICLAQQTYKLLTHFEGMRPDFIGDGKHTVNKDANVIVCVYNSVDYVKKYKFKYKFIDEAHHLEGKDSKLKKNIDGI